MCDREWAKQREMYLASRKEGDQGKEKARMSQIWDIRNILFSVSHLFLKRI